MSNQGLNTNELDVVFQNDGKFDYTPQGGLKVIEERKTSIKPAGLSKYSSKSSNPVTFFLGSDSQVLYGPNCSLDFTLNYTRGGASNDLCDSLNYRKGSYLNLFSRVVVTPKSSNPLEDTSDLAELAYILNQYVCNQNYINSTGTLFGTVTDMNEELSGGLSKSVCIPMHHLSSIFSQDKYLPLMALSPLKIELYLNNVVDAFPTQTTSAAVSFFEVNDARMTLDLYTPVDAVRARIMEMVRADALSMMYSVYSSNSSTVGPSSNTIILRKNVNKALSVFTRIKVVPVDTAEQNRLVSQAGCKYKLIQSWQYMIGTKRIPENPFVNDNVNTAAPYAMAETLKAFGNFSSCLQPSSVMLKDYIEELADGGIIDGGSHGGASLLGVDLERDLSNPEISGVSTNASQEIVLQLKLDTLDANHRYVATTWLHYMRSAQIGANSVMIYE